MKNKKTLRPTETELDILRILWKLGASTVRQVHNALNRERDTEVGYSTTLKMFQVMTQKGLVDRDETQRPQIYTASLPQEETQQHLVKDLLDRAFGGSVRSLVMQALSDKETSDEELKQLDRLLNKFEEKEK